MPVQGRLCPYHYEPFGGVLWQSGPDSRLSYIDKEQDAESGDHNFGVRQYDNGIGRFMAIDPLWEEYRHLTPYNYAENNPVLLRDPSGFGSALGVGDMRARHAKEDLGSSGGGGKVQLGARGSSGGNTGSPGVGNEHVDPEKYPMLQQQGYASSNSSSTSSVARGRNIRVEEQQAGKNKNHQNAAIAEARVFDQLIKEQGHIAIEGPGKVTAKGPDFITLDPDGRVVVADAKYRSEGGKAPKEIPQQTMERWMPEVREAVNRMPDGAAKEAAQQALQSGNVVGQIYVYP